MSYEVGPAVDAGRRRSDDRGAMVLVVAVVVAIAGLAAVATAELGVAMVERRRAQLAADAAALAGVDGGVRAATRLAAANGARLVAITRTGDAVVVPGQVAGQVMEQVTVEVTVEVGSARATARATNGP